MNKAINPTKNFSPVRTVEPLFYTIEDFADKVVNKIIDDSDGTGYYANEEKISNVQVILSEFFEDLEPEPEVPLINKKTRVRMLNGTHVAWYENY